jgi:hypothetical protein
VVNDVVYYNGSTYIAIQDTDATGITPSANPSYWSLVAQQGATGPTGPTGATGPAGTGSSTAVVDAAGKIYAYRGFR